jgi:GDP-4-dehydro-6-deoxy-D-mannose reductase
VYHLAAQSNIARSFANPAQTLATNVVGTACLLEALREHAPSATVVSIGSASEYGDAAKQTEFLVEDMSLLPTSPYGVSKVAQGKLTAVYARAHGMRAMHVRLFAILGPRKRGDALSDFCRGVVAIERGEKDALTVGNTSALRDFVDVRDCASGLRIAGDGGEGGATYNLCTGRATTLDDVIALLKRASGTPFEVRTDPARVRAVDDQRVVGNPSKLAALGFASRFSLEDTIASVLEYWRAQPQNAK